MTTALLLKEWREHRKAFAALFLLQLLIFWLIHVAETRDGAVSSVFVPLKYLLVATCPPAALAVSSRLITQEYARRTYAFIETLAVSRFRVLMVKLGMGAFAVLAPAAVALLLITRLARGLEPVTTRQLIIAGTQAAAFELAVYGFFFATSHLGRYRIPVYLGATSFPRLERCLKRVGVGVVVGTAALVAIFVAFDGKGSSNTVVTTRHYSLVFPPEWHPGQGLKTSADNIFEAVRSVLGGEAGAPLTVIVGDAQRNTAGTTSPDQIRVALTDDSTNLSRTMAHETTHALAARLARADQSDRLEQLDILNEGVAAYVRRIFAPQ